MFKIKAFLLCTLCLIVIESIFSQTKTLNGYQFEFIDDHWYCISGLQQYKVIDTILTIKFNSGVSEQQKNNLINSKNCSIIRTNILGYYDLTIIDSSYSVDLVEEFLQSPIIEIAEPFTSGSFNIEPNDPWYNPSWHMHEEASGGIDAELAWDITTGSPNYIIAFLDNGAEILHVDLSNNIWVNPGEDLDGDGVVWDSDDMNGIDDDGNGLVDDLCGWDFHDGDNDLNGSTSHGTQTSGISGAVTNNNTGVAGLAGGWGISQAGCKILNCRVGNTTPSPDIVDDAILYAAEEGSKVINMSLSLDEPYPQAVTNAINYVYDHYNCFVVASSGNFLNGLNYIAYPAELEKCFAVGACYWDNENNKSYRWNNSRWGEGLMLVAPGFDIWSTAINNQYASDDGTSLSSPQVAAVAGLIMSQNADFNPQDLETVLCITAQKISTDFYQYTPGYEFGTWNEEVGYGKLNAHRALGIVDDISSDITLVEGNYIRDEIHVNNGATLTLSPGSRFYLLKTGGLIIDEGATLDIGDNVKIYGDFGTYIAIHGNIQVGENVTFEKFGDGVSSSPTLYLSNNLQVDLDQVTFNEARLNNNGPALNITYCVFNNCDQVLSYRGNINISNTNFSNSWLFLTNQLSDPNAYANIIECDFTSNNPGTFPAIDISYYDNFNIEDNEISGYHNGIELWNSGYGIEGNQWIINNEIYNCIFSAIHTYNSKSSIKVNYVHNNYQGVRFLNYSNIVFIGDQSLGWDGQRVYDNISYEVYASKYSFPVTFIHNLIIDNDNGGNPDDPLLYFDYGSDLDSRVNQKDIRYNCWGGEVYFDPDDDLYPPTYFVWEPEWCPNGTLNQQSDSAEVLFNDGKAQFEAQNYSDAIISFETVVNQYPQTKYAEAAMKELFAIEQFDNSDFLSLKQYYLNNDSIQNDSSLLILSDFLVNLCDIEIENWQTSIDHYDSTITNPAYIDDSIFAIIDLGFTYTLMNNSGNRGTVHNKYVEHIPQSYTDFQEKRNYLLSLLPQENTELISKEGFQIFETGDLLQNIPNPFSENTKIYYKLQKPCNARIAIYDQYGRLIQMVLDEYKDTGIYYIDVNCSELGSGIYYYVLFINNTLAESKKMVVIK